MGEPYVSGGPETVKGKTSEKITSRGGKCKTAVQQDAESQSQWTWALRILLDCFFYKW